MRHNKYGEVKLKKAMLITGYAEINISGDGHCRFHNEKYSAAKIHRSYDKT